LRCAGGAAADDASFEDAPAGRPVEERLAAAANDGAASEAAAPAGRPVDARLTLVVLADGLSRCALLAVGAGDTGFFGAGEVVFFGAAAALSDDEAGLAAVGFGAAILLMMAAVRGFSSDVPVVTCGWRRRVDGREGDGGWSVGGALERGSVGKDAFGSYDGGESASLPARSTTQARTHHPTGTQRGVRWMGVVAGNSASAHGGDRAVSLSCRPFFLSCRVSFVLLAPVWLAAAGGCGSVLCRLRWLGRRLLVQTGSKKQKEKKPGRTAGNGKGRLDTVHVGLSSSPCAVPPQLWVCLCAWSNSLSGQIRRTTPPDKKEGARRV
jgi:hypothetical protein